MDIISLPIELEDEDIDGRFRLVNIAVQRARELYQGAKPRVSTGSKKVTTISLEEAVDRKLEFITGEAAVIATEEAKKLDYKKFLEEKRKEKEPEDLSELEKDLKYYLNEKEETEKTSPEELFAEGEE